MIRVLRYVLRTAGKSLQIGGKKIKLKGNLCYFLYSVYMVNMLEKGGVLIFP